VTLGRPIEELRGSISPAELKTWQAYLLRHPPLQTAMLDAFAYLGQITYDCHRGKNSQALPLSSFRISYKPADTRQRGEEEILAESRDSVQGNLARWLVHLKPA